MHNGYDSNIVQPVSDDIQNNPELITDEVNQANDRDNSIIVQETTVNSSDNITIIQTDTNSKDGQNKCPRCGSTEIMTNPNTGKLKCYFCRHEFDPILLTGMVSDISQLRGQVLASGAQDIIADTKDVLTFKCDSCGAEVVIDTQSAPNARCHWCRNTLSINQQIPNGSIPDAVLPFSVSKEDARLEIEKFVNKRKFFAYPQFKKEFTTENIMGVYFPYMIVDINAHSNLIGEGEHLYRRYVVGSGKDARTRYDADLYHVEREFDLAIEGLSIESNSDRLNSNSLQKTNNVINAIMPFDLENCVQYNSNYLRGFTSERRDVNVGDLKVLMHEQAKDIARFAANDTLKQYDRGVRWDDERLSVTGQQWKAAYLPVWLYSYQQVHKDNKMLHYVAVNARTKEVMGSVPINFIRLLIISALIELAGVAVVVFADFEWRWAFLILGVLFFIMIYSRYRNQNARHNYETETKRNMANLISEDVFIRRRTGLSNSRMDGANNTLVKGAKAGFKVADLFKEDANLDIYREMYDQNNVNRGGKL